MRDPEVVVRGRGDFRALNRDIAATEARFSQMGSTIKRGLATAGIAGTAALVKLGVESVKAGSAAEQSLGATETVFGKYADTVIRRSKDAADAVGLSANEYRELANVTGGMLQNAGTPLREVTKLTAELTKRAADMAATYGGSTKEAIESVSSLLRGEADPIERYGVSIKQSDINARLAAQGLDKLTGSARKQAEQQARLDLLMQQTAKTSGQFGREADTIAGKGQRLGAKVEDLEAKFSDLLIPALSAAADWASDEMVPALDDLHGWLSDNSDEFAELASTIKDTVLPPLAAVVDLGETAVDVFGNLPGPVKELAVQGGVAALVLPRVAAGINLMSVASSKASTSLGDAEKRTALLASTARTAAGMSGLLALALAAETSNDAVSTLATGAGAAAVGFSVGGPWGAAIGGAGGLLFSLSKASSEAKDAVLRAAGAAGESKTSWDSYRDTMDNVTGATTKATKAMLIQDLQQSELIKQAGALGISQQTLVNGMLGHTKASARLAQALKDEEDASTSAALAYMEKYDSVAARQTDAAKAEFAEIEAREKNLNAVRAEIGEIEKASAARMEELAIINKIPTAVQTEISTPGAVESAADIAQLSAIYSLTPEQVQTVIKLSGVETSKGEVKQLRQQLTGIGDATPSGKWRTKFSQDLAGSTKDARTGTGGLNKLLGGVGGGVIPMKGWLKALQAALSQGASVTERERRTIVDKLEAIKEAKPELAPYVRAVRKSVNNAKTEADASTQVGDALKQGLLNGMAGTGAALEVLMRSAVRQAIQGARAEGKINSPSRETDYVGRMLGEGLAGGMDATAPVVGRAGTKLSKAAIAGILTGVTEGSSGVDAALDALTQKIEKAIKPGKGKNADKREEKREKAVLKSLKDQYAALRANGQLQDDLNGKLEAARGLVEQATAAYNDYARAARDAVVATGDITRLGRQDDGTVSLTSLLNELEDAANNAERFGYLTEKLAAQGLSQESIDRILAAGPESALATVEAIETGGQAAVDKINQLQGRLDASGALLGRQMADRYYQSGVDAAQGLVNGLTSQLAQAEAAGTALAAALLKAAKARLRSNSPSLEFRDLGRDAVRGLDIGVDDTYAARVGASAASALVKGFDNPQLSADVVSAAGQQTVRVELRLTAEQISAAQRGKAILLDIDAARATGARVRAVTT